MRCTRGIENTPRTFPYPCADTTKKYANVGGTRKEEEREMEMEFSFRFPHFSDYYIHFSAIYYLPSSYYVNFNDSQVFFSCFIKVSA